MFNNKDELYRIELLKKIDLLLDGISKMNAGIDKIHLYLDELSVKAKLVNSHISSQYIDRVFSFYYRDVLIKFYLPFPDDLIQKDIIRKEKFWEANLLEFVRKKILTTDSICLDIGANIGNHSLYFSIIAGVKKVYSFEPQKFVFDILQKNLTINNVTNVYPYNYAIGDFEGDVSMNPSPLLNNGGTSVDWENNPLNRKVKVVTIDSLHIKDPVDFIKIDVEGAESKVINGAKNLLLENHPLLWIEIWKDFDKIFSLLQETGYTRYEKISDVDYLFS